MPAVGRFDTLCFFGEITAELVASIDRVSGHPITAALSRRPASYDIEDVSGEWKDSTGAR